MVKGRMAVLPAPLFASYMEDAYCIYQVEKPKATY